MRLYILTVKFNVLKLFLYCSLQNLGFQCVQDAGHFASVQCGFGVLRISPAGEICPCGRKDASLNSVSQFF